MSEQEKLIFKNVKASMAQARARKLIMSFRNGSNKPAAPSVKPVTG